MSDWATELGHTGLVLSGGVGLGAYQAGAYVCLHNRGVTPRWIAASLVGAVNAALIAGNTPEKRVPALRTFWTSGGPLIDSGPNPFATPSSRHLQNWIKVLEARLLGAPGHFRPRFLTPALEPFCSLYDLAPMRERLDQLVDFGRMNTGDMRCTVATTDIETGEMVMFDSDNGTPIKVGHLLASCGLLRQNLLPWKWRAACSGMEGFQAMHPLRP